MEPHQAPSQGALAALRAQVGVDGPDPPGRGTVEQPPEPRGQPLGLLRVLGPGPVVDEDDVEVRGIGELLATEATDGDHGERERRFEGGQGHLEGGLGQRGQVPTHPRRGRVAEEVPSGDAEQVALLPTLQRLLAVVLVGPPPHRSGGAGHQFGSGPRAEVLGSRQARDQVRVAAQHPAEVFAGADDLAQGAGDVRGLAEGGRELGGPVGALGQTAEGEQAEVGVRRLRQPVQDQGEELLHEP